MLIPEESKGIKQRQESGNRAKEAIIGLNKEKFQKQALKVNKQVCNHKKYMWIPIETVWSNQAKWATMPLQMENINTN